MDKHTDYLCTRRDTFLNTTDRLRLTIQRRIESPEPVGADAQVLMGLAQAKLYEIEAMLAHW